ncbi:TetR/AcrR family transcriptional regulator [Lipingzhangella rawalii]|uniref:TetR/AcrR family transcriptional regulator n=1 Tax=Lipingzhangella rawalii TaxID=2055835 RepID=UPI00287BAAA5|nr:TetR/AcrR family transcriptional regulator [Lipingzhangella rawalii]
MGVAAIAAAAGVTKKTLYDCFGSKDELVVAYLRDRHTTWWQHMKQQLATAPPPRTLALFEAYVDHPALDLSRGCGFPNGDAELPADHPAPAVIQYHKSEVLHRITELVAADRPELADPAPVTEQLFLLLEGTVALRNIDGDPRRLHTARSTAQTLLAADRPSL